MSIHCFLLASHGLFFVKSKTARQGNEPTLVVSSFWISLLKVITVDVSLLLRIIVKSLCNKDTKCPYHSQLSIFSWRSDNFTFFKQPFRNFLTILEGLFDPFLWLLHLFITLVIVCYYFNLSDFVTHCTHRPTQDIS